MSNKVVGSTGYPYAQKLTSFLQITKFLPDVIKLFAEMSSSVWGLP